MAQKCFMCGREISQGILCEKCDKPRKKSTEVAAAAAPSPSPRATQPAAAVQAQAVATQSAPQQPVAQSVPQQSVAQQTSNPQPASRGAVALDPFPKAPVLPFPVESASPAITSIASVLIATGVASVVVGPDRAVKFVTDEAKRLFDATHSDLMKLSYIESAADIRVGELSVPAAAATRLRDRNVLYSLVPLSGGASGAVLVFRPADAIDGAHASFMAFVRETVFSPLRGLHDSLVAAARTSPHPMLMDFAGTVDQILSSLEMAPEVEEGTAPRSLPNVSDIVRHVAERFVPFADLKNIKLEVDVTELTETFHDHPQLVDALGVLMDNSLHYVPPGGQVVIGVRWMEHKGRPLLLFFVMDNGPIVPEELRQAIFEPGFAWQPASPERTGRSLFRCREFAVAHGGSIWVESKTGKACTFFLRVRPDSVR